MGERRIEVKTVPFADRPALQLQWTDPVSGQRKTRSAKTNDPEIAEKRRGDLEYELNHGLHREGARVSWQHFRERFEAEHLPNLRPGTRTLYATLFDHLERICEPSSMEGITARTVSQLVVGLRQVKGRGPAGQGGMQPSSLSVLLKYLRAALRWAVRQGMLASVPAIPEVKVPRKRPRPVAEDLYQRLFVQADCPYLRAFVACGWLAGLRLGEAQKLSWEASEDVPWLDLERNRIWLPAGFVKAVEDQWLPLDPQLRGLLVALPDRNRNSGFVFPWHGLSRHAAGDRVIVLAKRAGVPLTMRSLRRGFGCRYAGKVPAQTLQRLMRHASIGTTISYYANLDSAVEEAVLGNRITTDRSDN